MAWNVVDIGSDEWILLSGHDARDLLPHRVSFLVAETRARYGTGAVGNVAL